MKLDLEAARQKNGVFIAQENYTEMLTKIELQEEEIMNKISALKVVKEEMDKKEVDPVHSLRYKKIYSG